MVGDRSVYIKGDATGDFRVTMDDKIAMIKHRAGAVILTDYKFEAADIDGDGTISAADVQALQDHLEGVSMITGVIKEYE